MTIERRVHWGTKTWYLDLDLASDHLKHSQIFNKWMHLGIKTMSYSWSNKRMLICNNKKQSSLIFSNLSRKIWTQIPTKNFTLSKRTDIITCLYSRGDLPLRANKCQSIDQKHKKVSKKLCIGRILKDRILKEGLIEAANKMKLSPVAADIDWTSISTNLKSTKLTRPKPSHHTWGTSSQRKEAWLLEISK